MAGAGFWAFKQLKLEAYPDISDPGVVVVTLVSGFRRRGSGAAGDDPDRAGPQQHRPASSAVAPAPSSASRSSSSRSPRAPTTTSPASSSSTSCGTPSARRCHADLGPLSRASASSTATCWGRGYDAMRLREMQDWVVTPRLLQVPGRRRRHDLRRPGPAVRDPARPAALDKYKFSVRQIADAVKNNNRNAGGALLTMGHQSLAIRGTGLIQSAETSRTSSSTRRKTSRSTSATSGG